MIMICISKDINSSPASGAQLGSGLRSSQRTRASTQRSPDTPPIWRDFSSHMDDYTPWGNYEISLCNRFFDQLFENKGLMLLDG